MPELQEVRPIDGNALLRKLIQNELLKMDALKDSWEIIAVQSAIDSMPTLEAPCPSLTVGQLKRLLNHTIWVKFFDEGAPSEYMFCIWRPKGDWYQFVLADVNGRVQYLDTETYGKTWVAYEHEGGSVI